MGDSLNEMSNLVFLKKIRKVDRRYFEILFLIFPSKTGFDISGKLSPWKNKISRMHFVKVFIIFQETGFTFHSNCLQSMHELSNLFFWEK